MDDGSLSYGRTDLRPECGTPPCRMFTFRIASSALRHIPRNPGAFAGVAPVMALTAPPLTVPLPRAPFESGPDPASWYERVLGWTVAGGRPRSW